MERKIAARYIVPVTGEPIRNGILNFAADGQLTGISENTFNPHTLEDVDYYDGVIVPGLVNTHCHLELSYMKGAIPKGTGLPGFIRRIMETKFTYPIEEQQAAVTREDKQLWESGLQAMGDISNTTVSFGVKKNSPIKYVTFLEIFDVLLNADYRDVLREGSELAAAAAYGLEAYVSPHSTYTMSDKLLGAFASIPHTEKQSIHFMESPDDDLLFGKEGKFWKLFQDKGFYIDFLADGSSTERVVKNMPGDRKTLLVHNSNVTQVDIDKIMAHFTDVSWALCPRSNLYIEQKLPPVELLRMNGLNITIGTDSLSSNDSLSMIDEIRTLVEAFNLPIVEVLRWATLNGAQALGLEERLGSFEVGKYPGAVLIEGLDENLRFTDRTTTRRIL